jgi:hypothetical protein
MRARSEPQVRGIDAHERLAALDGLPGIDQAFQDLAGNAEPQVALHPRCDDAGERTLRVDGRLHRGDPHEGSLCSRVNGSGCVVACHHCEGQQTDDDQG